MAVVEARQAVVAAEIQLHRRSGWLCLHITLAHRSLTHSQATHEGVPEQSVQPG